MAMKYKMDLQNGGHFKIIETEELIELEYINEDADFELTVYMTWNEANLLGKKLIEHST